MQKRIYTTSQAREKLFQLVDYVGESHDYVTISGKRNNAIIISEEDFRAIQETLYLNSIPGMKESILHADAESLEKYSENLEW